MYDNEFTSAKYQAHLDQHKLTGTRCTACGSLHLPPRPLCPKCGSLAMEWVEFKGEGTLVAFTTVHIGPTAMIAAGYTRDNPYCSGIVRLAEGPTISAQILGVDALHPETIQIGLPLKVHFIERQVGETTKTFLGFKPA